MLTQLHQNTQRAICLQINKVIKKFVRSSLTLILSVHGCLPRLWENFDGRYALLMWLLLESWIVFVNFCCSAFAFCSGASQSHLRCIQILCVACLSIENRRESEQSIFDFSKIFHFGEFVIRWSLSFCLPLSPSLTLSVCLSLTLSCCLPLSLCLSPFLSLSSSLSVLQSPSCLLSLSLYVFLSFCFHGQVYELW